MSWGPCMMYYHCPQCGKKFSYATDLMVQFGGDFGKCPDCHVDGVYEKDGARTLDDKDYTEVE